MSKSNTTSFWNPAVRREVFSHAPTIKDLSSVVDDALKQLRRLAHDEDNKVKTEAHEALADCAAIFFQKTPKSTTATHWMKAFVSHPAFLSRFKSHRPDTGRRGQSYSPCHVFADLVMHEFEKHARMIIYQRQVKGYMPPKRGGKVKKQTKHTLYKEDEGLDATLDLFLDYFEKTVQEKPDTYYKVALPELISKHEEYWKIILPLLQERWPNFRDNWAFKYLKGSDGNPVEGADGKPVRVSLLRPNSNADIGYLALLWFDKFQRDIKRAVKRHLKSVPL